MTKRQEPSERKLSEDDATKLLMIMLGNEPEEEFLTMLLGALRGLCNELSLDVPIFNVISDAEKVLWHSDNAEHVEITLSDLF